MFIEFPRYSLVRGSIGALALALTLVACGGGGTPSSPAAGSGGDAENGISIGKNAHQSATGMSRDFASPTFDTHVTKLAANSGSVTTDLFHEPIAVSHLQDSLISAGVLPTPQVGSWYNVGGNKTVLTFVDGAKYFVTQDIDDAGEPLCSDGMESGTYTWDSVSGDFDLTNVIDITGDCGLTSTQGETYSATVTVGGNTLTLTDVEGSVPFTKVVDTNNPIVGSWYLNVVGGNETLITFIDESTYFVTQNIDEIGEPLCADGMESGTYTCNSATGNFSLTNAIDTTGDCGLTSMQGDVYSATVAVSENTLTLTDV